MVSEPAQRVDPGQIMSFRAHEASTCGTLLLCRPRSSTRVGEGEGYLGSRLGKGKRFQFEQTSAIFGEYEDLNDAHAAAKC